MMNKFFISLMVMFFSTFSMFSENAFSKTQSPQTIVCNDLVNLSIAFNGECIHVLHPDQLLEGTYPNYDDFTINVIYPQIPGINSYPEGNILDWTHIGLTLTVLVSDNNGGYCVTQVSIFDAQPPQLFCDIDIRLTCIDEYNLNTDPREGAIIFPQGLFWSDIEGEGPIVNTPLALEQAINDRTFTVKAGVIDCSEVTLTYYDFETIHGCSSEDTWKTIERIWVATDAFNNVSSCQQIIEFDRLTIPQVIELANLTQEFITLDVCDPELSLPEYEFSGSCNVWSAITSEFTVPTCGNTYRLIRDYTFIDDCTGDIQTITRVFILDDFNGPTFTDCQNNSLGTLTVSTNTFDCSAVVTLVTPEAIDDCGGPVIVTPFINTFNISEVPGSNSFIANLPLGLHTVIWSAVDECGNTTTCEQLVEVFDGTPPVAVCVQFTTVSLSNDGFGRVFAQSFDNGSFDNCLIFDLRVRRVGQTSEPTAFVDFSCEDINASVSVELWVRDIYGNQNFCTVNVLVQDPNEVCDDIQSIFLGGMIMNNTNTGLNIVDLEAGNDDGVVTSTKTEWEGDYRMEIEPNSNLTQLEIVPTRVDDIKNGVTTLDMVFLQKNILGEILITDPYDRISADINGDGNINAMDMVILRRVLLDKSNTFENKNGDSWVFVDSEYKFVSNRPESEPYNTSVTVDATQNNLNVNFIGAKIGDVNRSATAKLLSDTEDRGFLGNISVLNAISREISTGDTAFIDFVCDVEDFLGYQMAISTSGALSIVSIDGVDTDITSEDFNLVNENNVMVSWIGNPTGKVLFTMGVVANSDCRLSNEISLKISTMKPEIYMPDFTAKTFVLRFIEETVSSSTDMGTHNFNMSVFPNPTREMESMLMWNTDFSERVTIRVMNLNGQTITEEIILSNQGENQRKLNTGTLPSGVYLVSISSLRNTETMKLVVSK
jgi:hypothetical protein